ncbi:hypothetical protein PQX77_005821 [Marasmius sp. AFHP31]|nr:hypothetical protein PQX77_005821 [Marasmius sp. AFHP31]
MTSFPNILSFVLLAISCTSLSEGAPSPAYLDLATRRRRTIGRRAIEVESFYPKSTFKTFGAGDENTKIARSLLGRAGVEQTTVSALQSYLDINDSSVLSFQSGYTSGDTDFGYITQQHEGIPFANAVANVVVKDSKLVSIGSSFVETKNIASPEPTFGVAEAIKVVEDAVDGTHVSNVDPDLEYLARPDGSVALAHVIQVQNHEEGTWFEAFVDAHDGTLLSVNDFVAHATYKVIPIEGYSVEDGYEVLVNPEDKSASPLGWHDTGNGATTDTSGNNAIAFRATQIATTSQSSDGPTFDYPYDTSLEPSGGHNLDASRVQAFYIANTIHDILYRYGFTETTYNFQDNNFGKGGEENDRMLMFVQYSNSSDGARIAVPPDGQSPECYLSVFTATTPNRDPVFELSIPIHELGHGLTQRMTGGGSARCLQSTEAGGLGEGWSDALADWVHQKEEIKDFVTGTYVVPVWENGVRTYPYSTSPEVNPLRANTLHNVHAALWEAHGYSSTAFTNPNGTEGNVVFLHIFIDALAIQPCNPTILQGRDAWIQADVNRYGGSHKCLLWKAFASRGLGMDATPEFVDGTAVPEDCN